MFYILYAYVETVAIENVDLSTALPKALVGLNRPAAASNGEPIDGAFFWNAFDDMNGNSFVYDVKKTVLVTNADAVDAVDVTFKTLDGTVNGLTKTVQDLTVRVPANSMAIIPFLPSIFKDGSVVKMSIAEVSAGDAIDDCKFTVIKFGS